MSRDYPTVGETEAYDLGFSDAENYWRPLEKERILNELKDIASRLMFQFGSSYHLFEAIKKLETEKEEK